MNTLSKSNRGLAVQTNTGGTPNATLIAMENLLNSLDRPEAEVAVDHFFSAGLYARKMILPPGVALVGIEHNHDHLAILVKGEVSITSKYGTAIFKAPYITNVIAGDKRGFFSVTEVEWMTVHATPETNLDTIETMMLGE
jgi:hypothetical protein